MEISIFSFQISDYGYIAFIFTYVVASSTVIDEATN